MTRLLCLTSFVVLWLAARVTITTGSDPLTYNINGKKWSHILDDHFISITVNPTDLLQGKAFGLGMNSTVEILKGLSPAYIRFGSADTGKYTFKRSRYPSDVARTEDEFIVTESHWTVLNDVARSAGLDIIVCLNAAHRNGANRKWDTRNTLELISFSDSQGYNLTFQLGYEVHRSSGISGHQYGKDLNRLRTILNAFPRYQNSKLIGPDIRVLHRKDEIEFVNDVLLEAGPILSAVTWHPRWPQPSKMKVSDISELGYEFPSDYIEWDRSQLTKILQKAIYRNPVWIGEPKTESTGTFAEGLLWARRLLLSAKVGIEVVMKQPTLMDISHPKPEYWIAFLHKRLMGRAVLETRSVNNQTEVAVITHCTNPLFWAGKRSKVVDGAVTVYAVNMGGKEQKVHVKGTWSGKSQIMLQYVLTSGSDPDSVFSQVTYLNGEPLMMTDEGHLPEIMPRVKRIDRGVIVKLPPYSIGFWVVPEARVKICQSQPLASSPVNFETLSSANMLKTTQRSIANGRNLNQLIVDKLKNPVNDARSDELSYEEVEAIDDDDSVERDSAEDTRRRSSRRVRQVTIEDIGLELKDKIREIRDMIESKGTGVTYNKALYPSDVLRAAEEKISSLTGDLGRATRLTDQKEELERFLHRAGLNQDFGELMMNGRRTDLHDLRRSINPRLRWSPVPRATSPSVFTPPLDVKLRRFRRSLLSYPEDDYEEESPESYTSSEETPDPSAEDRPSRKANYRKRFFRPHEDSDEVRDHSGYSGSRALKGLEDTYKSLLSLRTQDPKRKPTDPRLSLKKNNLDDVRKPPAKKTNILGNDLQEEILMKEVEVLQKTEEAMANLIKNHKKRQESLQEIILHEISDIKEDRLIALEQVRHHKEMDEEDQQKKDLTKIPRTVLEMLHKNAEPNPIVKRSIEDTTLNSLPEHPAEEKKLKIIKRSINSSVERSSGKRKWRRTGRNRDVDEDDDDDDITSRERGSRRLRKSRSERLERMKNFIQSRERQRDRNIFRRKHQKAYRKHKVDLSDEDDSNEVVRMRGLEYTRKPDDAIKEIAMEIFKKPERMMGEKISEERSSQSSKKEEKKQNNASDSSNHSNSTPQSENRKTESDTIGNHNAEIATAAPIPKHKAEEVQSKSGDDASRDKSTSAKKAKSEDVTTIEHVPLKMDKNRSLNVLKKISNLIETINSREKAREKSKKTSTDVEDLSEEFYHDTIAKLSKRRHRRSQHKEGENEDDEEDIEDTTGEEQVERDQEEEQELSRADAKALRKEILLRRRLERLNRRRKITEDALQLGKSSEGDAPTMSRLKLRKLGKLARRTSTEVPVTEMGETQSEHPVSMEAKKGTVAIEDNTQTKAEQEMATIEEDLKTKAEEEMAVMEEKMQTEAEDKVVTMEEKSEKEVEEVTDSAKREEENVQSSKLENEETMPSTASPEDETVEKMKKQTEEGLEEHTDVTEGPVEKVGDIKEVTQSNTVSDKVETATTEVVETKIDQGKSDLTSGNQSKEPVYEDIVQVPASSDKKHNGSDEIEPDPKAPAEEETKLSTTVSTDLMVQSAQGISVEEGSSMETLSPQETERFPDESVESYYKLMQPALGSYSGSYEASTSSDELGPYDADAITELMEGYGLTPFRVMPVPHDPREASWDEDEYPMYYAKKRSSKASKIDLAEELSDAEDKLDGPQEFATVVDSRIAKVQRKKKSAEEDDASSMSEPELQLPEVVQEETAEVREPVLKRRRRGIFDSRRVMSTPEERIRDFMRISRSSSSSSRHSSPYRRGNDIPMVADGQNFWKVAGSTVKAVFNDVIPEAYGKTKTKIENLGIAEYFKEFGKIVEQMKNLDRLFANIGQAAVRNYIKGSEDEKGDYIQVIEKKRRSRRDVEELMREPEAVDNLKEAEGTEETSKAAPVTPEPPMIKQKAEVTPTQRPIPNRHPSRKNEVRPDDLIGEIFLMDSNPGIVEVTKSPPPAKELTTSPPPLRPFQSRYAKLPKLDYFRANRFHPPLARQKTPRHFNSMETFNPEQQVQAPEISKFAPWMKTTKDFINQALTTLQRQRELSEMIARESVNDLVKREMRRKVIGKREISNGAYFPVYQVPSNRKRETYDDTSKYLTHLQPGVYIVPTEEMKNLRSEQIMKEAPSTKPGAPNMVTLNIYYDKKKPTEWAPASEEVETVEPVATNYAGYYQAPGITWSPVPEANQPEPIRDAYIPPLQALPPFQTDQDVIHYPNQYTEWIPPPPKLYSRNRHSYYVPGQAKSDWADFGVRHSTLPEVSDPGWVVQTQLPKKKAPRLREPIRPVRPFSDKKRSVDKGESTLSGLALPFWKFFAPQSEDKEALTRAASASKDVEPETEHESEDSESLEELFAENRKRAKMNEAKQKSEEEQETKDDQHHDEAKSRRKRDLAGLHSDLIPEWFSTVQDLDNTLKENRDDGSSPPCADYDHSDDDVLLIDVLHRSKRSAEFPPASVEMKPTTQDPKKNDVKEDSLPLPVMKRADSEDSSLEVPTSETSSSTRLPPTSRFHGDDALTQFFRYAYDSLIKMMKGMTDLIN